MCASAIMSMCAWLQVDPDDSDAECGDEGTFKAEAVLKPGNALSTSQSSTYGPSFSCGDLSGGPSGGLSGGPSGGPSRRQRLVDAMKSPLRMTRRFGPSLLDAVLADRRVRQEDPQYERKNHNIKEGG